MSDGLFSSGIPSEPGLGASALAGNAEYGAALHRAMHEPNPMARAAALAHMERIALGQSAPSAASGSGQYGDLLKAATEAPTPQARDRIVSQMEAQAQAGALDAPAPAGPLTGFEPPAGAHEYHTPPAVAAEVRGHEEAFGALKQAAAEAGVPPTMWSGVSTEVARLSAAIGGDQATYDAAAVDARKALDRIHGSGAAQIARDALAYIAALERAQPTLGPALDYVVVSPLGLQQAASLWRAGIRPNPKI
jgi:hypothetical protein